jgi:Kdo2-lipid IVA lauroyltransferase/acyltransferase
MKRNTHPLAPGNWPLWLAFGLLRLIVLLPYPVIMAIGRLVGRLIQRQATRRTAIARINIGLCFPELSAEAQADLVRAHFEAVGMGLMELGMGYWMSDERLRQLVEYQGLEHIQEAFARGKGVIFFSAHFTSLELSGRYLNWYARYNPTYRAHENPVVQYFFSNYRAKRFGPPIPREDVRGMLRALRENQGVWFAPDQNFSHKGLVFARFFTQQAACNPAISRFAQISGAPVLPYFFFRKPHNAGYRMIVEPRLAPFPTDDLAADTQQITSHFEAWVRNAPEQYNWMHRRFKTRPDGLAPLYP